MPGSSGHRDLERRIASSSARRPARPPGTDAHPVFGATDSATRIGSTKIGWGRQTPASFCPRPQYSVAAQSGSSSQLSMQVVASPGTPVQVVPPRQRVMPMVHAPPFVASGGRKRADLQSALALDAFVGCLTLRVGRARRSACRRTFRNARTRGRCDAQRYARGAGFARHQRRCPRHTDAHRVGAIDAFIVHRALRVGHAGGTTGGRAAHRFAAGRVAETPGDADHARLTRGRFGRLPPADAYVVLAHHSGLFV